MPIPMTSRARYLVQQRKVLGALAETAARALLQRVRPGGAETKANGRGAAAVPLVPGPELTARAVAPGPALVRDYLRHVGGDPGAYRGTVPPHLFPQWTFPLAARVFRDLPYPLLGILNSGCRLEVNAPVPTDAPLALRAQLVEVVEDERRVLLHQRVVTDTPTHPRALVVDLYAVVPTRERGRDAGARRPAAVVPASARELTSWTLRADAGLEFAFLTGDFNPVHWVPRYARAAGFRSPILHGFSMLARTAESLGRTVLAGAGDSLGVIDVRFLRPLALGRSVVVGLYLDGDGRRFYLADVPGGRPYLAGSFETRADAARGTPATNERREMAHG